jgi:tannase/feruloyl esterase
MDTMHEIIDPVQDDLTAFAEAGGKMIIYQGWGDVAQSAYRTIQYCEGLRRHTGRRHLENFARLFHGPWDVPLRRRCRTEYLRRAHGARALGGIGRGAVLDRRIAHRWPWGEPHAPLCPFPQHAVYKGTGSIDDAANFVCAKPPIGTSRRT